MIILHTIPSTRTEAIRILHNVMIQLDVLLELHLQSVNDPAEIDDDRFNQVIQIEDAVAGAMIVLLRDHKNCTNFEEVLQSEHPRQTYIIESKKFYIMIMRQKWGTYLAIRPQPSRFLDERFVHLCEDALRD